MIIRWLLLAFMFLDWTVLPDSADPCFSTQHVQGIGPAVIVPVIVFLPIGLRYREEAVRCLLSAVHFWTPWNSMPTLPAVTSMTAPRFFLPSLCPMYGLMCLQP